MATHLIAFSCSLLDDARRPPSTQCAHSAPFNPASVLLERMSVPPHERGVCLWLAHRQGRRERGRARLSWASFRGHRDRDDGGQDAEGEGAEQHRLDFYRGFSDGCAGEPSGSVRLDVTGAHQHHQLDHLIHLVVISTSWSSATPPAWRSFCVATGGFFHHSASSNFTASLRSACFPAGMLCAGVCDEGGACV